MCPGLDSDLLLYKRTYQWGVLEVLESKGSFGLVAPATVRVITRSGREIRYEISLSDSAIFVSISRST
jgi:hypothetical protein